MEKQTVSDLVKIDTLIQSFDSVTVKNNFLILKYGTKERHFEIKKTAKKLLEEALKSYFSNPKKQQSKCKSIDLDSLLNLPAFNRTAQMNLKTKIDDLIFDLYHFNELDRNHILELNPNK